LKRKISAAIFFVAVTMLVFAASAGAVDGTIEINQAKVLAAGGYPYTISTGASYRLTGNLTDSSASADAIDVTAGSVTLDLNGFSIIGASGSDTYGISASGDTNVTVENGTITGFEFGVVIGNGGIVRNLHATNDGDGIVVGSNSVIQGCVASSNSANGIYSTGTGLVISGNAANSNAKLGIGAGSQSTISGNSVYSNSGDGIYCNGSACAISNNTINGNSPYGILASDATTGYGWNVLNGNASNFSGGTSMGAKNTNLCSGTAC
jgi:parallel beta-helix repeat protein